eukprot:388663-Rhodomonas_salina.2
MAVPGSYPVCGGSRAIAAIGSIKDHKFYDEMQKTEWYLLLRLLCDVRDLRNRWCFQGATPDPVLYRRGHLRRDLRGAEVASCAAKSNTSNRIPGSNCTGSAVE